MPKCSDRYGLSIGRGGHSHGGWLTPSKVPATKGQGVCFKGGCSVAISEVLSAVIHVLRVHAHIGDLVKESSSTPSKAVIHVRRLMGTLQVSTGVQRKEIRVARWTATALVSPQEF